MTGGHLPGSGVVRGLQKLDSLLPQGTLQSHKPEWNLGSGQQPTALNPTSHICEMWVTTWPYFISLSCHFFSFVVVVLFINFFLH